MSREDWKKRMEERKKAWERKKREWEEQRRRREKESTAGRGRVEEVKEKREVKVKKPKKREVKAKAPTKPQVKVEKAKPVVEEKIGRIPMPKEMKGKLVLIFGKKVGPQRIWDAALEASRKRIYTVGNIKVENFIGGKWQDNLMVKVMILDRIQEQMVGLFPHLNVVRKDLKTLKIGGG